MKTWKRFDWQPGNGTRYDLIYGSGDPYTQIAWLKRGGSGGTLMLFSDFLHYSYIMEKMDINIADAVGILKFLELQGHAVGYPADDMSYETCQGEPYISEIQ